MHNVTEDPFRINVTMNESPRQPNLATYRKFVDRLPTSWPAFLQQRRSRLIQHERHGTAAEKVAENIVEDFFTIALDWEIGDLNNQLRYADIVLTSRNIKRLLVEVKRPGSLRWDQPALDQALSQARRYADEQRVRSIAVTDGTLFYAADISNGGLQDRARLRLDAPSQSLDAWWVSVDGIYRPPQRLTAADTATLETVTTTTAVTMVPEAVLLHPKHHIPAECFAYVGDASKTSTWKLPCRYADGTVDEKHLSGAIRALVTNYRGAHVKTVPDAAVGDVLVRLGKAAAEAGKLPGQTPSPKETYQQLYDTLSQIGRLGEVFDSTGG